MQHRENRFGQEIKPTPVNGIDKTTNAAVLLVGADGCPFLGPGKETRGCLTGGTGRHAERGKPRFRLIDVGAGHIFCDRSKWLSLFGDQRCHPIFICKTDPAIRRGFHHFGLRRFPFNHGQFHQILIFCLRQLSICAADDAFMQHKEILKRAGLAMPCHNAVGGKTHIGSGVVLHSFPNGEHVIRVNADGA